MPAEDRASASRRPWCRSKTVLRGTEARPWPSPAPPLQPPMFPDQRRTRQLAGRSLPPPFCCCGRVAPQLAATPVQRYVRTSSQCSGLPCLLRLHERVLHCCTLHYCAVLIASLPQPSQSPCGVCSMPCARAASQTVRLHRSSCTICHRLSEAQGRLKKATNEYVILAGSLLYRTECSARSAVWLRARSMSD